MSRGWANASACCFQILRYHALSTARWYPSSSRLVRLSSVSPSFLVFPGGDTLCQSVISYPSDVRAQVHFRILTYSIMPVTCVFSLTHVFVFLSQYVLLHTLLSLFVCAAVCLFFAWVVNAHVFAPYVITGSTHEL